MPKIAFLKALFHQTTAYGTRSTVLNPLGWFISILLIGTIASFYYKLPTWIGIALAIITFSSTFIYLICYIYCMVKDRDALRSEKFSIQKLLIEKGFFGDDIQGLIKKEELQLPQEGQADSPADSEVSQ